MKLRIAAVAAFLVGLQFAPAAVARAPWEGRLPYGRPLMTEVEVATYWNALESLETLEDKEAYWREHVEQMKLRALELGLEPPEPPRYRREGAPVQVKAKEPYFEQIMTAEELDAYHATMTTLEAPAERRAYIRQHILRVRKRGLERGVTIPSTHDWEYAFEEVGGIPPAEAP